MKKLLLLLLCSTTILANGIAQNYTLHANIPYDTIPGVSPNLLSLDVYEPLNISEPRPVIIYVHGGSWKGGTKSNVTYKADLFTEHNYVFVSINYRLSPNPPDTTISGVRFPIHPIDVAKAISFVYENIHQLNGDPQNMHLIGHSAGAHLVNLVATNQYFLDLNGLSTADIGCVCSLDAGVFDLPFELEIADASRRLMLLNAFGLNEAFYHQASPLFNIEAGEDLPDFLLIHQGTPLRILKTEGFRDSLHANGHLGMSFNAFPYSHGGINTGLGAPDDSIGMTELVLEFFAGCSGQTTSSFELEDVSEVEELVVYPNPSDGRIYFPDPEVREVAVFDVLGKELGRWSVTDSQMDLTHLGKGIYFIQVTQEAGRKKVGKVLVR